MATMTRGTVGAAGCAAALALGTAACITGDDHEWLRYVKRLGCDGGFVHAEAIPVRRREHRMALDRQAVAALLAGSNERYRLADGL